ncbi:MAG: hypothetical protein RTU92_05850 [Candidatus Thorarchaeota archaeon]
MSSEEPKESIDEVLDLLSKPLSRYILSVLAGVDPGVFTGSLETLDENYQDPESNNS